MIVPTDTEAAWHAWQANCGPAALAAILGKQVAEVRDAFPDFPAKPWCNPTAMRAALQSLRVAYDVRGGGSFGTDPPRRGLAFIQWVGPWLDKGVPIAAAYRNTHWIAVDGSERWDVNEPERWMPANEWATVMVARFKAEKPKISGWFLRTAIELDVA